MNKVILKYIIQKFLNKFLIILGVFYCFGLILNLFEEVEFFKTLDVSILTPLILTSIYIPGLMIKVLPFIIFISTLWFMLSFKHSKDLLTIKIFGFSNIKIFLILALCAFLIGWMVLFVVNPITSNMSKYYEQVKSEYSRDVDHLINFKKDGLWIKEKFNKNHRFISSKELKDDFLTNITILHLDEKSNLLEKIGAEKANVTNNEWILYNVNISRFNDDGIVEKLNYEQYKINSIYNLNKIRNLFKNFDTMSFMDLSLNFNDLLKSGYTRNFLNQSLHSLLTLPFFLLLMTGIASILTMSNLTKNDSIKMSIIGLVIVVVVYYLKDFSLALGQIEKVPLILSIWAPIIALSLFSFIGVIQINEK